MRAILCIATMLMLAAALPLGGAALAQPAAGQKPAAAPEGNPAAGEKGKGVRLAERELNLNPRQIPLGGALKSSRHWQVYKSRFITAQGRVIDSGNKMISHSEGQGYGMLLAVAANDRATFDRIWGWTRANLMVRDDVLMAWRWEPNTRPAIADMNNATDGDILVAWALTEAAELWSELSYRVAARRIAVEVGRKLVMFKARPGALLLPAIAGFSAKERSDGPVINLSYYVFPAFARLIIVAPEYDWPGLAQAGLDILKQSQFGSARLPSEWISVKDGKPSPANGFDPVFGYNAIRVPLYMAWAGIGDWEHYAPFFAWARIGAQRSGPGAPATSLPVVRVGRANGKKGARKSPAEQKNFGGPGYAAVGALLSCVYESGARAPAHLMKVREDQHYYPATLQLLSIVAIQMRYEECLKS